MTIPVPNIGSRASVAYEASGYRLVEELFGGADNAEAATRDIVGAATFLATSGEEYDDLKKMVGQENIATNLLLRVGLISLLIGLAYVHEKEGEAK